MLKMKPSIPYPSNPHYNPYVDSCFFFFKVAACCTVTFFSISQIHALLVTITTDDWWYIPILVSLVHALIYYPTGYVAFNSYEGGILDDYKVPRPRKVGKYTFSNTGYLKHDDTLEACFHVLINIFKTFQFQPNKVYIF